ncbi:MerR family DNA-binding transcriptional regulator [Microbacterium bovistercoris]|uniref:MerR family DNA-binding transcriptional regulator n=1 Tax=Microbacterium bovistercoris TaxID=2293570 RepID=A0A371NUM5_9MICO|nr:MerR family DNA-binding transcriptional regulator [Microbacterium bovistercoris]REJ06071.1 MerR family DNA-binding transcriptional regulator [Microbacterium bovistercoris]
MLIGEVAAQTGISTRMLRHYDSIGLVSPSERTAGGYRRYTDSDLQTLLHVEALRALGLGLPEVAETLGSPDFSPATVVDRLLVHTAELIAREQQLLRRLERIRSSEQGAGSEALHLIGLMHGVEPHEPPRRPGGADGPVGDAAAATAEDAPASEADPNAAGALDWALARIGDRAVPLLKASLASPDVTQRRKAAVTLEKIGSARALAALAGALEDSDTVVRARAALIRGRRGDLDAVPALVDLIVQGVDDVEAIELLAGLAVSPQAASEIIGMISERIPAADAEARARLTGALAEMEKPAS